MTNQENFVCSVANLTKRLTYYGTGDIVRISCQKVIFKYFPYLRSTDLGEDGESMKRIISRLSSRIEFECNDICK